MAKLISAAFSMRNIVLVLLAYFCFATAGSFAETVTLHPPLQEGAKISLEMNATRERQVEGQPAKKGSSSVIINVEVIEVEADHVVIGWTTGQGKLHSENPDPGDQVVETISSISAQQSLELVFDREFNFMAIRNIEDVINKCQKSLDMLERMFPARGSNSTVTAKVREMLQDPETVQTLMIQKPGRYFLAYGWELEPGTMRKQEMSLPSPLGGAPLPAVLSIELESFQADDEQYLVTWHQELDKEGDERVLQQAFKRFSAGGSSPPDLPKFDVDDRAEFRINRKTGWIEHATVVRSVKANEGSQIETFEFRAVADGH